MNERIRAREVRVIGANGENYGVIPFQEAMSRAREASLDLVEVDSNGQPPVCRILDYGKFKYEQAKRERDARKHQRGSMIHEVRLRPRTGQHDIDLKVRIAKRLLDGGDKVKLSVMFRGREISHPEVGQEVLDKALSGLTEVANIEKTPGMEGRFLTAILTPIVKKPVVAAKPPKSAGPKAPKAPAIEGTAEGAADGGEAEPEAAAEDVATEDVAPPAPEAATEDAASDDEAPPAPEAAVEVAASEVKTTAKAAKVDESAAETAAPAAAVAKKNEG
ncbi:MAG: translation initiation factor IF-3 [Dehalococcoidia bacterium]